MIITGWACCPPVETPSSSSLSHIALGFFNTACHDRGSRLKMGVVVSLDKIWSAADVIIDIKHNFSLGKTQSIVTSLRQAAKMVDVAVARWNIKTREKSLGFVIKFSRLVNDKHFVPLEALRLNILKSI